ncbi:MAG: nucleoside triphosphate pyrophosphohydrolase, partial [Firmicutes bacterium]|nr:nucleoside triphosphate pyrophosphohydrolase [Bacillota bacterium]
NAARFMDIDPEYALTRTSDKFTQRFGYIEEKATEGGRRLQDMTLEEMDALWEEAKSISHKSF